MNYLLTHLLNIIGWLIIINIDTIIISCSISNVYVILSYFTVKESLSMRYIKPKTIIKSNISSKSNSIENIALMYV